MFRVARMLTALCLSVAVACAAGTVLHKPDPAHPGATIDTPATPAVVAADLGKCFLGAESSDPALVKWLGSLIAKPDGATIVSSLLTGTGAQLFACGAAELATMSSQDTAAVAMDRGALIYQRADICLSGPCERIELRMSRVLRDLSSKGKLKLPPSGQG